MSRVVGLTAIALLVGAVGCEPKQSRSAPHVMLSEGTNVLFITLDTTRADRLGCYGYATAATPALDGLASRGVLFERTYSQVPLTLPSHASIVTGCYPKELGVRVNGREALGSDQPTIAEVFHTHSYATGAIIAAGVLDSRYGLDRGFDVYQDDFVVAEHGTKEDAQRRGDGVTDDALSWLDSVSDKPFFAWIHYYDPHDPYDPPPPFDTAHPAPYDGEIAFMDAQIKRVLDWLDARHLRERTLIVAVGDHGESFGEHGTDGHTTFLYGTDVHVPMIFSHPALQQGHRNAAITETIDVFPTLLTLMGWPLPEGLHSRSLDAALRGDQIDSVEAYAESHHVNWAFGWAQQRALTTSRWKYISSTVPELYDVDADPDERQSVIQDYPKVARQMREALQARYAQMTPGQAAAVALDEDARRALESLGYLSGGTLAESGDFLTPDLPDPKDMVAVIRLTQRAGREIKLGNYEDAVVLLAQAAEASPKSMSIHYTLGLANRKLNRHEAAIEALRNALLLDPRNPSALSAMGSSLGELGRRDEAISYYRAALAIDERKATTHRRLAVQLRLEHDVEDAIRHLLRAIELDPVYASALTDLGEIYGQRGEYDRAIEYLRRAVAADPDSHERLINLALVLARAGQVEESAALHERVLRSDPGYETSVSAVLSWYLGAKRVGEAVQMLRAALPHAPNSLVILKPLSSLLATAPDDSVRDGNLAVELSQRAVTLTDRSDPVVLATLAAALAETGAFDKAVAIGSEAADLARSQQLDQLVPFIEMQLAGYREERPFRDANLRP